MPRWSWLAGLVLTELSAGACGSALDGGTASEPDASGSGGGGGGTATSAGGSATGSGGGSTGAAGGIATGGGGSASCAFSPHSIGVQLTVADGPQPACPTDSITGIAAGEYIGVVQPSSDPSTLTIDTCAPTSACAPSLVTLSISDAFVFEAPAGSFARVQYRLVKDWDCMSAVVVSEVGSFGGIAHPDAKGRLWAVVAQGTPVDGMDTTVVPFSMTPVQLDCSIVGGGCPNADPFGVYAFRFVDKNDATNTNDIYMSDSVTRWIAGGQAFALHNARSVDYWICDVNDSFDYWVSGLP